MPRLQLQGSSAWWPGSSRSAWPSSVLRSAAPETQGQGWCPRRPATGAGSGRPRRTAPFSPRDKAPFRWSWCRRGWASRSSTSHALRRPPLCAATNESTGVHVHLGCYPRFFSVEEVAAIMKVYLRFEATIYELMLPVTRERNGFCRDLPARGSGARPEVGAWGLGRSAFCKDRRCSGLCSHLEPGGSGCLPRGFPSAAQEG